MPTVAEFIIDRISPLADSAFGLPGDYVLDFYSQLSQRMKVITTTDEQCAGFAADAYARVRDFGIVCTTYCVGGFKLLNPIAGAFAEKSPVLVISGSPGVGEKRNGLLLHHVAGAYSCQRRVFQNVTCASAILDDPTWAAHEIDRVIAAIRYYKQPGYIEIPRDMVNRNVRYDVNTQGTPVSPVGDKENLEEALLKSIEWIRNSKNPVILAGVEISRFGLGLELMKFAERANIPVATTILGKSVINEHHPLSLGIYSGRMSKDEVRSVIEESDCVLMLGVLQTDVNLAFQPFQCNQTNVIMANTGRVKVRRSTYENVKFFDFTSELLKQEVDKKYENPSPKTTLSCFTPRRDKKVSVARMFEKINSILDKDIAVVADVGDALLGASDLTVHHRSNFIGQAFYASMGSAVPGALGVQVGMPHVRPVVIVGDGAFQMTGMELSTIARLGYNPIVFVINNGGYGTERLMGFDESYNDIQNWNYHKIVDVIGSGTGYLVETEDDLEAAVNAALVDKKSLSIINVVVDKMDSTPALQRMIRSMSGD